MIYLTFMSTRLSQLGLRIHRQARDAPRTKQGKPETATAVPSILLAAAALEAFINEMMAWAGNPNWKCEATRRFHLMRKALDRGRTLHKYRWAWVNFTGDPYPAAQRPYQDFEFVFRLRNALLHGRERAVEPSAIDKAMYQGPQLPGAQAEALRATEPPGKLWAGLKQRGLVEIPRGMAAVAGAMHWVDFLKSPDTEHWACELVAEMYDAFVKMLPEGEYKRSLSADPFAVLGRRPQR